MKTKIIIGVVNLAIHCSVSLAAHAHVTPAFAEESALAEPLALEEPAMLIDPRFTGHPPVRDPDGTIRRSMYQKARFIMMHPCPATDKTSGACPGWSVDHVIPLGCGGKDEPINMQWLPLTIKSCAGTQCKDRWERSVYRTAFSCERTRENLQ